MFVSAAVFVSDEENFTVTVFSLDKMSFLFLFFLLTLVTTMSMLIDFSVMMSVCRLGSCSSLSSSNFLRKAALNAHLSSVMCVLHTVMRK